MLRPALRCVGGTIGCLSQGATSLDSAFEHDGRFTVVDIGAYLGQPDAWRTWLTQQVGGATAVATGDTPLICNIDGCAT